MENNSEKLKDFMSKKNAEARGEALLQEDDGEGDTLKDQPRAVNQDAGEHDTRAAKALTTIRLIMNLLFIIPIALASIALVAYILIKFLPSALFFIKKLFVAILSAN